MTTPGDPNQALSQVSPRWDAVRTERALAATRRRLRRRRVARAAIGGVSVSAVAVSALLFGARLASRSTALPVAASAARPVAAPLASSRVVRFTDGSSVELRGVQSSIEVHEVSSAQIVVELEEGDGHFRVAHKPEREFVVRAGWVSVRVVGTEFDMGRRGARTWVDVVDGLVRVDWPHASATLHAGARGLFPPDDADRSALAAEADAGSGSQRHVEPSGPRMSDARHVFRDQITRKDYAAAYGTLSRDPTVVGSSVADLMLAADVARLTGHPDRAIRYLRRVVDEHPESTEAHLAAFTAGRLYVGLGQHERAEQMFAKAGDMAPAGQLAEDALVRQVLAAAKAGEHQKAQRLAREYMRRFPSGRRSAEVRKNAGL